jgi:hypothetical protein
MGTYIEHTKYDHEGIFGYNQILGHLNGDDLEHRCRPTGNKYYQAVDFDGHPIRHPEGIDQNPRFCNLTGAEITKKGEDFEYWSESTIWAEGARPEEPIRYHEFEREDEDGEFKPEDYQGTDSGIGEHRRANAEWRIAEAQIARDQYGFIVYCMHTEHHQRTVRATIPTHRNRKAAN